MPSKYTKYNPNKHPEIIAGLIDEGKSDLEIASILNVAPKTLREWKRKDDVLKRTIQKAKEKFDKRVEEALYKRALGYDAEDVTIEAITDANGEIIRVGQRVRRAKRHIPADPTSMIWWLKNRDPNKWRDRREVVINDISDVKKRLADIFDEN